MERAGRGQPMLFLGGTGWDLRRRDGPLHSELTAQFQVLLFDQRGMGRSDKPPGPYTIADYANDAAAIMDAVGWNRAHVAGYSFGGMVAQELAISHSDRVASLMLAATTAGGAGGSSYPIHEFLPLSSEEQACRALEVADLRFTPDWRADNPRAAQERMRERMETQNEYIHEPRAREGLTAQLQARARHDSYDRLHLIKAPTLVLAASMDGQAPVPAQRRMAERIDTATFKILDGSHSFIIESDAVYRETRLHALRHPI